MIHFDDASSTYATVMRSYRLESFASLAELAILFHRHWNMCPRSCPLSIHLRVVRIHTALHISCSKVNLLNIVLEGATVLRHRSRVRQHHRQVTIHPQNTQKVEQHNVEHPPETVAEPWHDHLDCRGIHAEYQQPPRHEATDHATGLHIHPRFRVMAGTACRTTLHGKRNTTNSSDFSGSPIFSAKHSPGWDLLPKLVAYWKLHRITRASRDR